MFLLLSLHFPLLAREIQLPIAARGQRVVLCLGILRRSQSAAGVFQRQCGEVRGHLGRHGHLPQRLGDGLKQLLHDSTQRDHLPHDLERDDEVLQADRVVVESSQELKRIFSNSQWSLCSSVFYTCSLPMRICFTAVHASSAVSFAAKDGTISGGKALVMTSSAIRSSFSGTPPGSIASHRSQACNLIFITHD